jgi:predicted DNA binding CopG/RHH family protein
MTGKKRKGAMRTTMRLSCEVPAGCKARAKAAASLEGIPLQEWVAAAIESRLSAVRTVDRQPVSAAPAVVQAPQST